MPSRADEQPAPNSEVYSQTQLCHGAQGNKHTKNLQHGQTRENDAF